MPLGGSLKKRRRVVGAIAATSSRFFTATITVVSFQFFCCFKNIYFFFTLLLFTCFYFYFEMNECFSFFVFLSFNQPIVKRCKKVFDYLRIRRQLQLYVFVFTCRICFYISLKSFVSLGSEFQLIELKFRCAQHLQWPPTTNTTTTDPLSSD